MVYPANEDNGRLVAACEALGLDVRYSVATPSASVNHTVPGNEPSDPLLGGGVRAASSLRIYKRVRVSDRRRRWRAAAVGLAVLLSRK
eukprot:SAG11_NODE_1213_length_5506_cov_2.953579_5_plen_88_part_00